MDLVKKYIRCGLFGEARQLIENDDDDSVMMQMEDENGRTGLPLLIMLALIREEPESLSISRLLIEKGFRLNAVDSNGLCALNYAIALNKLPLVQLFLSSFDFDLHLHRDR